MQRRRLRVQASPRQAGLDPREPRVPEPLAEQPPGALRRARVEPRVDHGEGQAERGEGVPGQERQDGDDERDHQGRFLHRRRHRTEGGRSRKPPGEAPGGSDERRRDLRVHLVGLEQLEGGEPDREASVPSPLDLGVGPQPQRLRSGDPQVPRERYDPCSRGRIVDDHTRRLLQREPGHEEAEQHHHRDQADPQRPARPRLPAEPRDPQRGARQRDDSDTQRSCRSDLGPAPRRLSGLLHRPSP